ncbi:DUF357 domain-containing protein [Candidatus Woesearchaeota archaeon]|nr:DUF357 domain-containing protein [Candidatus Woesearchaeota archaeon]
MEKSVSKEKLEKYFAVTAEALGMVRAKGFDNARKKEALEVLDMAQRYYDDAGHFREKGDWVTAFAALNYAHGWLDCGARLGLFKVKDSRLFTVDDE